MNNFEKIKNMPVVEMAKYFNVSIDYLITGKDFDENRNEFKETQNR